MCALPDNRVVVPRLWNIAGVASIDPRQLNGGLGVESFCGGAYAGRALVGDTGIDLAHDRQDAARRRDTADFRMGLGGGPDYFWGFAKRSISRLTTICIKSLAATKRFMALCPSLKFGNGRRKAGSTMRRCSWRKGATNGSHYHPRQSSPFRRRLRCRPWSRCLPRQSNKITTWQWRV